MSIEQIKQLDSEIEKAERKFQATLKRLDDSRALAEKQRDQQVTKLQAKRGALVLKIKLKEYPAKLVKKHKTCSICGEQMRPFKIARGEEVVKLWACSAGNLADTHDLVPVE